MTTYIERLEESGSILAEHLEDLQNDAPKRTKASYELRMTSDDDKVVIISVNWKED